MNRGSSPLRPKQLPPACVRNRFPLLLPTCYYCAHVYQPLSEIVVIIFFLSSLGFGLHPLRPNLFCNKIHLILMKYVFRHSCEKNIAWDAHDAPLGTQIRPWSVPILDHLPWTLHRFSPNKEVSRWSIDRANGYRVLSAPVCQCSSHCKEYCPIKTIIVILVIK